MTRNEIIRRWPNASETFIKSNLSTERNPAPVGLPANHKKPTKRHALDRPVSREDKGVRCTGERNFIRITVRARRCPDFDGVHVKELIDALVCAKVLPGDSWDLLQGQVVTEKVHSKDDEATLIEIWYGSVEP